MTEIIEKSKIMKIKSIFILVFLSLIFTFCGKDLKNKKQQKQKQHKLTIEVQNAVDSLSLIDEIRLRGTKRFDDLLKVASNQDLVFLTKNKNPKIRCYAFNGLIINKYPELTDIFFEHLKDTSVIQTRYECTGERTTVMNFMLNYFHPKNIGVKNKFSEIEYNKYNKIAESYKKNIKPVKIENYEKEIKKLQNNDLEYFQDYYCADSKDEDFEVKRKLVKKNIEFVKYEEMVLATAYFEVNGCNSHFPNIERRNDTIILKYQMRNKYPCDEKHRIIEKINFVIFDQYVTKIKTVIAE
ncbi:hypothetical protein B0A68_02020 [Flavobacterium reichenbachii]|uniref:Uncharacterized protein n=2 Tax=Flavobacterium reichenbachii TaxID=362418 RepID=A0A085ZQ69_9FLAO|nr:hypothetical protein IW19_14170 [Flavobacterium reichenbachii]OXB18812.1 hypothetical protein B0A68_02020 [Flavobacterium reichenbachii]